jgi:hypothetical protein
MARYRDYDDDYAPHYTARSNAPAWTMAIIMLIAAAAFLAYLAPDLLPTAGAPAAPPAAPPVSRQAPAIRGGVARPATGAIDATPIPGMAQNQATADAQFDAAVQAGEQRAAATPVPLPLNSVGEPIIDQVQQAQMQQSLTLAEQEGGAAADRQLQNQRATAYADAASRPPDVSYEDARDLNNGRDPCSVPRADPHTCAQGVYKPTPVN